MKTVVVLALFVMIFSVSLVSAQATGGPGTVKGTASTVVTKPEGCTGCSAATATSRESQESTVKPIPGTNETMVVGKVENLIPIGVLTVLGCEKCSAEAVNWALQQGSSFDEVERTLRTVAATQKLDCFKTQFGPEVNSRMEKPLAAANEALAQARTRAAK